MQSSSGATVRDLLDPCHSLTGREEVGGSGKLTIKREQLICRRWRGKRKEGRQPLTQKFPPLHSASQNINWVRNELELENTAHMRYSYVLFFALLRTHVVICSI